MPISNFWLIAFLGFPWYIINNKFGGFFTMNFAEKLCVLRNQSGYSQEQLAEKMCVSRQAVSKWESGATLPETEKIIQLSDLFDVSTDFLLRDAPIDRSRDTLDRVVFKFLGSAQEMDGISKNLIDIMQDGIIDDNEKIQLNSIIKTLDELVKIIDEIKMRINAR